MLWVIIFLFKGVYDMLVIFNEIFFKMLSVDLMRFYVEIRFKELFEKVCFLFVCFCNM